MSGTPAGLLGIIASLPGMCFAIMAVLRWNDRQSWLMLGAVSLWWAICIISMRG